eukprot:2270770-Karenia_brevis.AAC.1
MDQGTPLGAERAARRSRSRERSSPPARFCETYMLDCPRQSSAPVESDRRRNASVDLSSSFRQLNFDEAMQQDGHVLMPPGTVFHSGGVLATGENFQRSGGVQNTTAAPAPTGRTRHYCP